MTFAVSWRFIATPCGSWLPHSCPKSAATGAWRPRRGSCGRSCAEACGQSRRSILKSASGGGDAPPKTNAWILKMMVLEKVTLAWNMPMFGIYVQFLRWESTQKLRRELWFLKGIFLSGWLEMKHSLNINQTILEKMSISSHCFELIF